MIAWLNAVSGEWFDFMLLFTIQNSVFLSVILIALYLLRNKSPKLLKILAISGLIKLFIPPLPALSEISGGISSAMPIIDVGAIGIVSSAAPATAAVKPGIYSVIMLFWLVTASALFLLLLLNIYQTVLKIRQAERLNSSDLSCEIPLKNITVLKSKDTAGPYIIGLFHYYLMLPWNWHSWDKKIRKSVIAHESAHIKEGDQWINLLKIAAVIVHFFNPFVWLLIRRLNYLSEVVCDNYSVALNGIPPKEYNKHLLTIVQGNGKDIFYKPVLSFSRAHKMIKNRMFYQLKRKDGDTLKTLTLKSKLAVSVFAIGLLMISLQCTKTESPTTSEGSANQTLAKPQAKIGDVYALFAVDEKPIMLHKEKAEYPESARSNGVEGMVVVLITIDKDGSVIKAEVPESLVNKPYVPNPDFVEPSLEAARKCKFKPAKKNGELVKVQMYIPYAFRLQKKDAYAFSDVDKKPVPLNIVTPKYPEVARKAGIEGVFVIKTNIDEYGRVIGDSAYLVGFFEK